MEKFDTFCENNTKIVVNQSQEKSVELPKKVRKKNVRTISDISNVERIGLEKLRKPSVVERYHSVYLKKYAKGLNHRRHPKKLFVIPVFHVSRRPDNPFNVKNAVQKLKRKQMTSSSNKTSDPNSSVGGEVCYSNLERRLAKSRNWESIRYKYQLDYKEKLKMERENYLTEYSSMKKPQHKQQRFEHNRQRPLYQNTEMKEVPRNFVVPNDQLIMNLPQRTPHRYISDGQNVRQSSPEAQTQVATFSGRSNIANESIKYYGTNDGSKVCDSVDLAKDYENGTSVPRSEVNQMRLARNERENNSHCDISRSQAPNHSGTMVVYTGNSTHEMTKKTQREDFDFAIPYQEQNILVKVMTGDTRNPINIPTQMTETLQYTESKQEFGPPKRVSFDDESNANKDRPDPSSSNTWLQHLQNILNKTCDPQAEYLNKKLNFDQSKVISKPVEKPPQTSVTIPRDFASNAPIQRTATTRKPNVTKCNTAVNPHSSNHIEPSSMCRLRQDRPTVSNPKVIKPKVVHPSPYFRPDTLRNSSQYNEHFDDPISVTLPVRRLSPGPMMRRHSPTGLISNQLMHSQPSPTQLIRRHSPAPLLRDQASLPQHMEYVYGNHPNYHHEFMVRSDVPHHPNLIGPPVYSPYHDQAYVHYRNEMERMPQPAFVDPSYMQHGMPVPSLNRTIGFLPRPSVPSAVFRYLNPQHVHPVWIYPHILER